MALNNAIGSFSLGRDVQVVVMHPLAAGGRLDLQNITGFDAKPAYDQLKSKRLSGDVVEGALPAGYSGTISLDRGGPQLDNLQALIDAAWHLNGMIQNATIFRVLTEPDGSVTTMMFTDCGFMVADLGNFQPDQIVKQSITFSANRMVKV